VKYGKRCERPLIRDAFKKFGDRQHDQRGIPHLIKRQGFRRWLTVKSCLFEHLLFLRGSTKTV
jgi:hypothetical protein